MSNSVSNEYDLAVVGAGTSGIAAARFYLETHPTSNVVILERDHSVGGVWSSERVYPGFRSQGGVRTGGFSDVKFDPPKDEVDDQDFYEASTMADYLDKYVDEHKYLGKSLRDRIRFGTTITGLQQLPTGWILHCTGVDSPVSFKASKVIVASGGTSEANMPDLNGQESFGGPIVHTLNYGRSKIYEEKGIDQIAVIGGGKSSADMVYENVKAGRRVKWIIRKSGKGPGSFLSQKMQFGSIKNAGELALVRLFPSILVLPGLQAAGWWQRFLYNTKSGAWVLKKLGELINEQFVAAARYDDRPGAKETFKLLKSEMDGMALNAPAGGVHHDDFWDTISQNVDVYREDIDHLEKGRIVFTSGQSTEADAILCGTGFKETIPFLTTEQCIQLGLPHPQDAESPELQKEWSEREAIADQAIQQRFYKITPPPKGPAENKFGDISLNDTPFRLYNCMAPTDPTLNRSIVFVGFSTVTNMFANSEFSAVWATAYLDGHVKLPTEEDMKNEIAYNTTYMRLRNPTYGRIGTFYVFDYFPFLDKLMAEVGLTSYRKSWWKEQFQPFLTEDLKGLKDEYIAKYGKDRGSDDAK